MSASERGRLLILTGAPGVGKTTAARALAGRFERAAHVEADPFFDFIRSGHVEPWKPESRDQNSTVMRIVAEAASAYAAAGYFTIVDGIVIPRFFLEPVLDVLRRDGAHVAYAVLRAPLSVCLTRTALRESQAIADPDVVAQLWREFAELGAHEANVVDVEGCSPDAAAGLLLERLEAGALSLPARA